MSEPTLRRAASMAPLPSLIPLLFCLALIPSAVVAQPSVRSGAAVPFGPPTVRPLPRFSASAERIQSNALAQPHVGSRDSLRDGVMIGAVIGAVASAVFAATLCNAYQEPGGASCLPDTLRFAVIGGAIGAGAGLAVDAARTDRGVTVRFAIRF